MKNKQVLITGATSGIGMETARALANIGASIAFTGHRPEKDTAVRDELRRTTGNPEIHLYHCDLSSFASIAAFVSGFRKSHQALDVLINNAGIWRPKRMLTPDGIESHLAINHLAPVLMTRLLMPLLKSASTARIINTTSGIHFRGKLDLEDLEFKNRKWRSIDAYTQSKLCNILFTRSLASQLADTSVSCNSLAPGWVNTGLFRDAGFMARISASLMANPPAKAARALVHLACTEELRNISGAYFAGMNMRKSSSASYDKVLADKLWIKSEEYFKDYI
jgi:NAD(P)-dependent dehydrogenase (short-subunit alcohol dehydrogenase family)